MIDSHAHIYSDVFDEDRDEVIARAKEAGIDKIILANADMISLPKLLDVCKKYPDTCYGSIGLHPTDVKADYKELLAELKSHFDDYPFVAIGEIGVDLYWDKTFEQEQKDALLTQIAWAVEKDLPIILHIRDAFDLFYEIMDACPELPAKGVIHSFSGTIEDVRRIKALGNFYFGINGIATFKNSNMDDVVKEIGLDRLMIETDAPFLAPVPKRGKRNEPAFVAYVADKMSDILETSVENIIAATTKNTVYLFDL